MAGNQLGLGRMLQSIGQSMGQWGEQKRQAEQAAMQRALQMRELELREQAAVREQAQIDEANEQNEFTRTFNVANATPEGAVLDPTLSGSMKKFGMGSFIKPAAPATIPTINPMTGVGGPGVGVKMPERMIATQPPGFRQADRRNDLQSAQFEANLNFKLQDLQRRIEAADRAGDIAGVRAQTAALMALIAKANQQQQGANIEEDNIGAWEKRALEYAKALVGDDITMLPEARAQAIEAAVAKWKAENPRPTGTVRQEAGRTSGLFK